MTNYFYIHYSEENDEFGVGYAPKDMEFDFLDTPKTVHSWKPITLFLKEGEFSDYLANDLGWRLCSEKLMHVIERCRGESDAIVWLPLYVEDAYGNKKPYFVLHLPDKLDILDKEKTIFVTGEVIVKGVLDSSKVEGRCVFSFPGDMLRLIVAQEVKEIIEQAGCTGIEFSKVPVNK
jgi:hypothetical protein